MISLILLLLLVPIAYWHFTKNLKYWTKRGLNGPTPLPLFGNLLDIFFIPRNELELSYYSKYGNIYGYYLGSEPVLVVGEPELIKTILVKDFSTFSQRRGNGNNHPITSKNLANIVGDDWKRVRSITSPTFTSNKMKLMYPLMQKCVDTFVVHLEDLARNRSNVNIKDIFGNLTLDVIASSAFGTNLNSQNELDSLFVKHARQVFKINPIKMLLTKLIPEFMFSLLGIKFDKAGNESRDFYVGVVREIIESRKRSGETYKDFVQLLIDADDKGINDDEIDYNESHHVNEGQEELEFEKKVLDTKFSHSNKKLTEDEIVAQAVAFLMAGYETTATSLTYATYELALHPEIQDKLCDEVNASLNSNGNIDYDVLSRLPYLDAIISETLRHHSPASKISRLAVKEYTIGNTGIRMYPGQQVDIPIYAIHHDERYYSDPFEFDPERFMPAHKSNLVPYTYLPFGGGPRNCIGMRFALLESKLTLAQLVLKYKFFRCDETDVPLIIDPKALLSVPKRAVVGIEMRR